MRYLGYSDKRQADLLDGTAIITADAYVDDDGEIKVVPFIVATGDSHDGQVVLTDGDGPHYLNEITASRLSNLKMKLSMKKYKNKPKTRRKLIGWYTQKRTTPGTGKNAKKKYEAIIRWSRGAKLGTTTVALSSPKEIPNFTVKAGGKGRKAVTLGEAKVRAKKMTKAKLDKLTAKLKSSPATEKKRTLVKKPAASPAAQADSKMEAAFAPKTPKFTAPVGRQPIRRAADVVKERERIGVPPRSALKPAPAPAPEKPRNKALDGHVFTPEENAKVKAIFDAAKKEEAAKLMPVSKAPATIPGSKVKVIQDPVVRTPVAPREKAVKLEEAKPNPDNKPFVAYKAMSKYEQQVERDNIRTNNRNDPSEDDNRVVHVESVLKELGVKDGRRRLLNNLTGVPSHHTSSISDEDLVGVVEELKIALKRYQHTGISFKDLRFERDAIVTKFKGKRPSANRAMVGTR